MLDSFKSIPEQTFEDLLAEIKAFQSELSTDHEIGIAAGVGDRIIHVTKISNDGGQLIIFHGIDGDLHPAKLIQHYTQLSMALVAVGKLKDEPNRMGFDITQ